MDRLEGRFATLDIVPDGVDHRVGALQCRTNRRLVPYVGIDRSDPPSLPGLQAEWHATGVTHRHPHIYAPGP